MFNFAIFFISENGRWNFETINYIQVSRARPPGPAWLCRFKQKFRLACLVGTSHCPLDSVSWSGLLDWTGAMGVLCHGVSLTSVTSHKPTGWYTKAILSEKCCNPFHRCLEGANLNQIFKGWYVAHCSPIATCSKDLVHKVNRWTCRQTVVLRGWPTNTNKSAEWSNFIA